MTDAAAQESEGPRPRPLILGLAGGAVLVGALALRQLASRRSRPAVHAPHGTHTGALGEAAAPVPERRVQPTPDRGLTHAVEAAVETQLLQAAAGAGAGQGEPSGVVGAAAGEPSSKPVEPLQGQTAAAAGGGGSKGGRSQPEQERPEDGSKGLGQEAGPAEITAVTSGQGAASARPAAGGGEAAGSREEEGGPSTPAAQPHTPGGTGPALAAAIQAGNSEGPPPAAGKAPASKGAAAVAAHAAAPVSKNEMARPREDSSEGDGGAFDFSEFLIRAVAGAVGPSAPQRPPLPPQETTSSKLLRRAFGRGTRKAARGTQPAQQA